MENPSRRAPWPSNPRAQQSIRRAGSPEAASERPGGRGRGGEAPPLGYKWGERGRDGALGRGDGGGAERGAEQRAGAQVASEPRGGACGGS